MIKNQRCVINLQTKNLRLKSYTLTYGLFYMHCSITWVTYQGHSLLFNVIDYIKCWKFWNCHMVELWSKFSIIHYYQQRFIQFNILLKHLFLDLKRKKKKKHLQETTTTTITKMTKTKKRKKKQWPANLITVRAKLESN